MVIQEHYAALDVKSKKEDGIIFASLEPSEEQVVIDELSKLTALEAPVTIVPHDIARADHINSSLSQENEYLPSELSVIKEMGLLLDLYPTHHIAYVGGGFDKGIHNIAEPLLAGCQVIIGPNYAKDEYANDLIKKGWVIQVDARKDIITSILTAAKSPTKYPKEEVIRWLSSQAISSTHIIDDILASR